MKVWLYYRLSRDEDDELNSLTNQRKIIYEYAVTNGHEVVGESFDDNLINDFRRVILVFCVLHYSTRRQDIYNIPTNHGLLPHPNKFRLGGFIYEAIFAAVNIVFDITCEILIVLRGALHQIFKSHSCDTSINSR